MNTLETGQPAVTSNAMPRASIFLELLEQLLSMRDAALISAEEFDRILRGFRQWASWPHVMAATAIMSGFP